MKTFHLLEKILTKAQKNGFKSKSLLHYCVDEGPGDLGNRVKDIAYEVFIFDHAFAKAFFGQHMVDILKYKPLEAKNSAIGEALPIHSEAIHQKESRIAWEYHLQQLAIAENRLAYLEKFL